MKIAIVGGGIAGLGAAWALNRNHDISLYEANEWLGGHAHTVDIQTPEGTVPVDTGFLVYNERTYPHLTRLFDHLGVATRRSDMSFSFSLQGGLEYAGSGAGLFAQRRNLVNAGHWRMVRDIARFRRRGPEMLTGAGDEPLAELLIRSGFSTEFIDDYLLPMAAAIWSSRMRDIRRFPAKSFLQFFSNHGLISITDRPQWRTVDRGSRNYVDKLTAPFADRIHLNRPVVAVHRHFDGVRLRTIDDAVDEFDHVVFASHSDQTLAVLGSTATPIERKVLGAIRYEHNRAVLHHDAALMPRSRRAWSSWNYSTTESAREGRQASVTYWINRLQSLPTRRQVFVSLNPVREPDPALVVDEYGYAHPQFDADARAAQQRIPAQQGTNRTWFAGAYLGYGFHEDGLQSGLNVAAALGSPAPWYHEVSPVSSVPAAVLSPA
ncbi:MAG: FAD-dependent oxidoreductase [Acidimicrobiia bacterium]|nr:FAD-dependent oxidoreductase [Acidimicrobiia bacterium]